MNVKAFLSEKVSSKAATHNLTSKPAQGRFLPFASTKLYVLCIVLAGLFIAVACEKPVPNGENNNTEEIDTNTVNEPDSNHTCNCIMDTLKGEWTWVKIVTGEPTVIRDNFFTSTIKILSQNADSSVNYEVWVKDSLFSRGSFLFKDPYEWGCIPHYFYHYHSVAINIKHFRLPFPPLGRDEEWNMLFTNNMPRTGTHEIEGDTTDYPLLVLWICGINYFYQKIK